MTSCISKYFSSIFSLFEGSVQPNKFNQDLQFIKTTVLENHPGIQNTLDPDFLSQLNKSYRVAEQQLNQVRSEEEKINVIKNFGKSFKDAHLWVQYDFTKSSECVTEKQPQIFGIQKLNDTVNWISIPTFAPDKNQIDSLQEIIRELPQMRQETIIFDLRGNGGGNSTWGTELLKALFGAEYSNYCLDLMNQKVYAEWRVSPGNLKHIEEWIPMFKKQFPKEHPAIEWAETTYQGMKNAIEQGNHYYSAPETTCNSLLNAEIFNLFKGKAIAIVDRGCGSACLDFLDGLKAVHPNVILIGETTGADSVYMELRTVQLPSGKGTFGFPIKVYRNRSRGHNVPYIPDVKYHGDLKDTLELQKFILRE